MIGRGTVKRKPQELFKRDSVVDLCFQLRIGIDLKPLLKKNTFHQEKRRIGIVTLEAFTNRIVSQKQAFNSGPVYRNIDEFHSFDRPILFHRVKKRDIGKSEVSFHVFEARYKQKLCLGIQVVYPPVDCLATVNRPIKKERIHTP